MAGKRKFEEQLAALDELRQQDPERRVEPLRKALANRNNYVVGKAADLVRSFELKELIPELLGAYDRFFADAAKSDPQCWAKTAISRALAAFEYQEPDVFLRGMKHIQMEPAWGGASDSAGTLRATCALALVQCRGLVEVDLLRHLVDLLADKDKTVRAEVVRAIEQLNSNSAALLLRLRAALASDEPEVLGACYGGVLRIEGIGSISWVSRFMDAEDDAAAEAALAIAGTHSQEASKILQERFARASDPWFRSALLSAMALTRQNEAMDFLLGLVKEAGRDAEAAIEAICRSMPNDEVWQNLGQLVKGDSRLERALSGQRSER